MIARVNASSSLRKIGVYRCVSRPCPSRRPGKPTDNAYLETFNGTLRAECLDTRWFDTVAEAKKTIEAWGRGYNESRPRRALGGKPPNEFAQDIAARRELLGLQRAENLP